MTWTPPYQINYASTGDTVYGAVVKCDNNIADAYSKLTILDTYRTEDHADISQLELAFDSLDAYVDDIASDVATLQQDLDTLEGSVSTLSSTVSGNTSSIGTLQSDLGTLSSTVSGHTSTLSSHTSTLSSHTSSISSLTSGKVDIASANTISADHVFSGNPTVSGTLQFTGSGYIMSPSYYVGNGTTKHLIKWDSSDDTLVFSYNGSWQQSWPYAYTGTVYLAPSTYYFSYGHQTSGVIYAHTIYYGGSASHLLSDGLSIDTKQPSHDRWMLHENIREAYNTHDVSALPSVLKHEIPFHTRKDEKLPPTADNIIEGTKTCYSLGELVQVSLECIDDLRTEIAELKSEIDALRGKGATPRVSVIPPRTLVVDI